jgi:hypothetical protein
VGSNDPRFIGCSSRRRQPIGSARSVRARLRAGCCRACDRRGGLALVGEHLQGGDDLAAGVGRIDDGVDVAALGGDVRVEESFGVVGSNAARSSSVARRCRIAAACPAPITASSAHGQARHRSFPIVLESMTM